MKSPTLHKPRQIELGEQSHLGGRNQLAVGLTVDGAAVGEVAVVDHPLVHDVAVIRPLAQEHPVDQERAGLKGLPR